MLRLRTVAAALLAVACSSSHHAPVPTPAPAPAPAPTPTGGSPFETFATTSPRVGEAAPGFELADVDGRPFKLFEATARGPVVLVWGSFT